jgi:transcriptional regulator with XRE-family HTH domain
MPKIQRKNIQANKESAGHLSDADRITYLREQFGSSIKQARRELGLLQAEVAKNAQVSPEYISVIEHGKQIPSDAVLLAIANTLKDAGITYQSLLFQAMEIEWPQLALQLDEQEYAEELQGLTTIDSPVLKEALQRLLVLVDRGILNQGQSERVAKEITRTLQKVIGETPADEVDDHQLVTR